MKMKILLATIAFSLCLAARAAVTFSVSPPATTNLAGSYLEFHLLQNLQQPDPFYQFQWFKGATNLVEGARVAGVTSSTLTIANATLEDTGIYRVSIASNGAVLAWATGTLQVVDVPVLQNVYLTPLGAGAIFTAEATGGLLQYQWLWQGRPLAGATSSSLRFADAYASANAGYYSVVVTNIVGGVTSAPNAVLFTKPVPAGTYQGIFWMEDGVTPESAGSFQYTVSGSRRSYSGTMVCGTKRWRFSGKFSLAHTFKLSVPRDDGSELVMAMQFLTTNDTPQLVGTINDGSSTGFVQGNRLAFSSTLPTTLAGRYTVAFQNTNPPVSQLAGDVPMPLGDGFAAVALTRSGTVAFSGRTADGARFAFARGLSRLGDVPVHAQTFRSRGQLLGFLRVAPQAGGNIRGDNVAWMKYPGPDKRFPDGYAVNLKAIGSTYVPTNSPVLTFTNGVASLYGGDLYEDGGAAVFQFSRVYLRPPATLVAEPSIDRLELDINRSSGTLSGSFRDLATGLKSPIYGIVLPQQNSVRGYFLSLHTAGAFTLMPAAR